MSRRRSGINPIAYLGVEPITPPELVTIDRAPNSNDVNYDVGTIWLYSTNDSLWMLTRFSDRYTAVWTAIDTGTAGALFFPTNAGQANVMNSTLNALGDVTGVVRTTGAADTLTIGIPSSATQGQLVMSNILGTQAVWGTLTSSDASIVIDATVAGTLDITVAGGVGATSFPADVGVATPTLGVVEIKGGPNINTSVSGANKILVNLNKSILLPITNTAGTEGVIALGTVLATNYFMHGYGTNNAFLGDQAGSLTLTVGNATDNTGVGKDALDVIDTGAFNTAAGSGSLDQLTSGSRNVAVGETSLTNLVTGDDNIALGRGAGSLYVGAESSNIVIGNTGSAGTSSRIYIGTAQTSTTIAGIYNQAVGGTNAIVYIDNTGKLGTTGGSGSNFASSFATDVGGPAVPLAGTINIIGVTNQLRTDGATANTVKVGFVTDPQVTGTLTAGTGLVATTGGITATGTSAINASGATTTTIGTGGTGIVNIGNATGNTTVTGHLDVTSGHITATSTITAGTGLIATTGGLTVTAGNTTLTPLAAARAGIVKSSTLGVLSALIDSNTNGQLLISSAGGPPAWASLTSSNGTITITAGANSIDLIGAGGGGGGTTSFTTDVGGPAAPTGGGNINFTLGSNISTDGATANTVKINLVNSPSVSGTITAGTGLIATTGGVTAMAGGLTATADGLTVTAGTTTLTPLAAATAGTMRSSTTGVVSALADTANNGYLLISAAAGAPIWASLTSGGGSVTITRGVNSINLEAAGVAALTQLSTDVGGPVNPLAGNINLTAGSNISTDGNTANTVKINLINSPSVSGSVTAGTGLIATTGGVTATGTSAINASGGAATTIGTGGTGVVNIGNATGNTAVTGSLTASTGLVATAGGITATGTSAINASGGAVTTIGTGGTGAVNIGNATGNTAVTGALSTTGAIAGGSTITAATGLVATTGGLSVLAGGITSVGTTTLSSLGAGVMTTSALGVVSSTNLGVGVVMSDALGALTASTGAAGRLLIGTAAGTAPVWATLTAGANVTILNASGSITISASGGGGGSGAQIFQTNSGAANVSGVTINFPNGANTNTTGSSANVFTNLNTSIVQPVTSANGLAGVYSLGSAIDNNPFMHAYGTSNTFLGQRAGARAGAPSTGTPFILTGARNTGIGFNVLEAITSGNNNTCVGSGACDAVTTGGDNVGVGRSSLGALTTGSSNVAIGQNAGQSVVTNSDNTMIGDSAGTAATSAQNTVVGSGAMPNVTTGANNIVIGYQAGSSLTAANGSNIIIGANGSAGANQIVIGSAQQTCKIVGIHNVALGSGNSPKNVIINSTGQLGTTSDAFGTVGQLLVGAGASTAAVWVTPSSPNGTLRITNSPAGVFTMDVGGGTFPAFLARQTGATGSVTGDGTVYTLGSSVALSEVYDQGNDFAAGVFTAPVTGKYFLQMHVTYGGLQWTYVAPTPPPATSNIPFDPQYMITSNRGYEFVEAIVYYQETQGTAFTATEGFGWSVVADMDAGDTCSYQCWVRNQTNVRTIRIEGNNASTGYYQTFVSGHLVAIP